MSVSTSADHFFQTTQSLDEINRKSRKSYNTSGDPIKLPSKLLAVSPDPANHGAIYVAESAGTVKRIVLETKQISHIYRGPAAPLTSLCFGGLQGQPSLYAGCWDKSIWQWDLSAPGQIQARQSKLLAHADFVKCLLSVQTPSTTLILSGGAEGDIVFWDAQTGERQHKLKGQSRAIQDLVLDPLSDPQAPTVFVATSERDIYYFSIPAKASLKEINLSEPILVHETSAYKLFFDADGDLWTASADKTAKHLVRENGWKADTTLKHPDFVRDVVVHERSGLVVTACRDEEVRVWDQGTGELQYIFTGHFEEVTGLCLLNDWDVVSISIDATVRRWSLRPDSLAKAKEEAKNPTVVEEERKKSVDGLQLTEEEERELQEMMANEEIELQDAMAEDRQ